MSASDLSHRNSGISVPVIVGSSVGVLVLGIIVGVAVASLFYRYNKVRRNFSADSVDQTAFTANQERFKRTEAVPRPPGTAGPDIANGQYHVEPFLPEGPPPTSPTRSTVPPPLTPLRPRSQSQSDGSASGPRPAPHVYVVHHDGGGAPVTVFTGGGGVTELPPSYIGRSEDRHATQPSSGGSGNTFDPNERRPRPGPTPRKPLPELP